MNGYGNGQGQDTAYPPAKDAWYPPGQQGQYPPGQQPGYPPGQPGQYPAGQQPGYPPGQPGQYPAAPPAYSSQVTGPGDPGAWQPNMGGEIPKDDSEGPPPQLPQFDGYNSTGFDQLQPTAPPPPMAPPKGTAPAMEFSNVVSLSADECKEAMAKFVAENCCFGTKPAKEMIIESVKPSTALHLTLETFAESRSSVNKHEPFPGGGVDGPHNGRAPGPWEMQCHPDNLFNDHTKKMRVPHTESVSMCNVCWGRGFVRCRHCHGRGHQRCSFCHGSGHRTDANGHHSRCHSCGGDGRKRCNWCHGDGRVRCPTCHGYRQLKHFVLLVVSFKNHMSDFILEGTDMPDKLVRNVSGTAIYKQELPQVWPIVSYPIQSINQNSIRLIESHRGAFPNERILQQRHILRGVPVTECDYRWKDYQQRFWVYGLEERVYCPDYPQQCCWGCSII